METQKTPKNTGKYHCKLCDFNTCHLGMWKRHLKPKNILETNGNTKNTKKHHFFLVPSVERVIRVDLGYINI